jgi:hypothetical protein
VKKKSKLIHNTERHTVYDAKLTGIICELDDGVTIRIFGTILFEIALDRCKASPGVFQGALPSSASNIEKDGIAMPGRREFPPANSVREYR